jgi:Holliday junction resolvasome RuvABC ATP-dependent DNA helicase subunit
LDTLFDESGERARREVAPLAVRLRPRTLDEFVGQEPAVGPGTWLRAAIERDQLSSLILYGPAGTGKTSLARIIAAVTKAAWDKDSIDITEKLSDIFTGHIFRINPFDFNIRIKRITGMLHRLNHRNIGILKFHIFSDKTNPRLP